MKKTELLAPAKNKQIAFAAIDCGADAVYMGASSFGARKNAPNTIEDIAEVVEYAHKFWAKVFITINTILTDAELEEAVLLIKELDRLGVDAVIVQDLGLLKRLIDEKLKIPIHMSTQCDNRELEKITFFNNIGVSRVVLARELSLDKIKEIHNANENLELEAFIHGALCVSYSGQCYLSQYIGGRSANRGECAQPCRKKYSVKTSDGKVIAENIHALCLKDFNASNHISEMIDAGVFSFKIEGRLKEIEYVKNVTAYYRQELDKYSEKISSGKSIYSFEPCLEKSFNRGFTDYFLEERTNCFNFVSPKSRGEYLGEVIAVSKDFFVINTNKTIHPQDGLMYESDGFLVNKVVGNKIYPNKKFEIKKGTKIFRNTDVEFQKKLILPVKRQIGVNLFVGKSEIVAVDEDNISYSLFINATDAPQNLERMIESYKKQLSKTGDSDFYIKNIEISSDVPFMLIGEINSLRRNLFDGLMKKRLEEYMRESQKEIKLLPYYKTEVDYRANVHNASAKAFYNDCNCNVLEPSLETSFPKHQVELMRTKHCIKFALGICKSEEDLVLIDECGKSYPLKFDCKNCEMVVLSSQKK